MDYRVSIDDSGLRAVLTGLTSRARNLRPAMEEVGEALQLSTDMRFERQQDPSGQPWTPLAPATVRRKGAANLILQLTGALRRSITRVAGDTYAEIGTNLAYAAIHQFGGIIERAERTVEIFRTFIERKTKGGVRAELLPGFVKKSKANFASEHVAPAHQIVIPARTYAGINADDRENAIRIVRDFIMGGAA